jgi:hypothetical protein
MPLLGKMMLGILVVFLSFFNDPLFHGWGLPAGVAVAAIGIPLFMYRSYWQGTWFWLTLLALLVLQVPLVIACRPLMDQLKFGFNILFATLDVFLVAIAVNWVRPKGEN